MSVRISLAAFVVLLVGCQATPAPFLGAGTRLRDEPVVITELERQIELLTTMFGQDARVHLGSSSPGEWIELNARLGQLTGRLDCLIARLPATGGPERSAVGVGAAEASGRDHPFTVASNESEEDCIAGLAAGLAMTDQIAKLCVENITNVNMVGYKKKWVEVTTFRDEAAGMEIPRAGAVRSIWTTGALEITDRSLDVAIDGDGLFEVLLVDGTLGFTRNGNFHVNADGKLVTGSGNVLMPEVNIAPDTLEISISPTGTISGRTAGNPDVATGFGRLALSHFINPSGLRAVGDGVFQQTKESGSLVVGQPGLSGLGTLKQGFLERSNVQVLNEYVNLQLARRQRAMLVRQLADFGVFVR